MLNRVILIGRLTKDPELRYTPAGVAVAQFVLAVDRPFTSQEGEREADFIPVVTWRQTAEACANYLRKGRLAAVEGRIQVRNYENNEGKRVYVTEVIADNVRFLESGREDHQQRSERTEQSRGENPSRSSSSQSRSNNISNRSPSSRGQSEPYSNDGPINISDDDLPF